MSPRWYIALIFSCEYANGLLSYEAVSPRMVSVGVKIRTGVRNTIQVYAPDSSYCGEDLLLLKISVVQKAEELQVQGDLNVAP